MKDHRFLPVEKREPVDDYDDYVEEGSDESSLDDVDADELLFGKKQSRDTLYIAS
ncbi:TPA: hypothetical protein HA231_02275 [Candidatus Woesearchaeota archaeon]|nr:hypothetical protein [Candidatus Woesearchaeota archaeon]